MEQDPQIIPSRNGVTPPLVDRLDPVLGEAASGIGAMLTELVRRTLRGGIQRVDDELAGLVGEKVDGAVASRLPHIEEAAVKTAERTAHEVAAREVADLDSRTRQTTQRLQDELAATGSRLANELAAAGTRLETTARDMVGDLERRSTEATRTLVSSEVSGLEQRTGERLTTEIHTLEQRTGERLVTEIQTLEHRATTSTQDLVSKEIAELERRASEQARMLVDAELNDLREKAKAATQSLHKHVNALHEAHGALRQDLLREQEDRLQHLAALEKELGSKVLVMTEQVRAELERSATEWRNRWMASEKARSALAERLAELERPRGIRALTARLFGRKKPADGDSTRSLSDADIELTDVSEDGERAPASA